MFNNFEYDHNKNMKKNKIFTIFFFLIPMFTLLSMSLILMYHAKYITNIYANHFLKQSLWIAIGLSIIIASRFFNMQNLFKYARPLYYLSIISLILVLLVGENINGAKAWINCKWFLFQPSELMKLTYSLYLSSLISTKRFYNPKQAFMFLLHILILFLIPAILVFLEPDTGAIIFYFLITITALYSSNLQKRWIIGILIIGILLIGFILYTYFFQRDILISVLGTTIFYRMERLLSLGEGMQINHALIALGSAPLMKWNLTKTGIYIPESPTDFIFSLSSNVFGLLGNMFILLSYFLLDIYFLSYLKKQNKKDQKIFTSTFLSLFIPSQIINIGMNLGLLPIIGIPLPFLSYGGSSTIILFLYLAIIFSVKEKEISVETLII